MNKTQINLEYKAGYGANYANLRKKQYNKKRDYSVRELAAELNISSTTISLIEKERREPTVEQVLIYKKFFGASLDYLVGDVKTINADLQTVCEYMGLSEETVKNIISSTKGELCYQKRAMKYLLSDLSSFALYDLDRYAFLRLKKDIFESLVLKQYLNEKYPHIPVSEIDKRGIHIFRGEVGKKWFKSHYYLCEQSFYNHLLYIKRKYKIIDPDLLTDFEFEEYKLSKKIIKCINDVAIEYTDEKELCKNIENYYSAFINSKMSTEEEMREYYLENFGGINPSSNEKD